MGFDCRAASNAGRERRDPVNWNTRSIEPTVAHGSKGGQRAKATFPPGVERPIQFGPILTAKVIYFRVAHFLPERRIVDLRRVLLKVSLSQGTVRNRGSPGGQIDRSRAPESGATGDTRKRDQASGRDRLSPRRSHLGATCHGHSHLV